MDVMSAVWRNRHSVAMAVCVLWLSYCPIAAAADSVEDAQLLILRGDYARAIDVLRPLVAKGDGRAEYILGNMALDGRGVPRDSQEAMRLYEAAAAAGDVDAQYVLGAIFLDGAITPKNYARAHQWLAMAAAQGRKAPTAQYRLATIYIEGLGCAKDLVAGHMWLNIAATNAADDHQRTDYEQALLVIGKRMTLQQIRVAQAKATRCERSDYHDC